MKYIITETQYNNLILENKNENDVLDYLMELYPEINNLDVKYYNGIKGFGKTFSNPKTKEVLFRTVKPHSNDWTSGEGLTSKSVIKLLVQQKLNRKLLKNIINYEPKLINWFNVHYKDDVEYVQPLI